MVIFKLFMDIVKKGWVRVIYDGSGNFQVFSGFLWPKLRVPHCNENGQYSCSTVNRIGRMPVND